MWCLISREVIVKSNRWRVRAMKVWCLLNWIGSSSGYYNTTRFLIFILILQSLRLYIVCSTHSFGMLLLVLLSLSNFSRVILYSCILMRTSFRFIFSRMVDATSVSSVSAFRCFSVARTASFAFLFLSNALLLYPRCSNFGCSSGLCLSPVANRFRLICWGDLLCSYRLASTSGSRSELCVDGERSCSCRPNLGLPAWDTLRIVLSSTFRSSFLPSSRGELLSFAPTDRNETELDADATVVIGPPSTRRVGLPAGTANVPGVLIGTWTGVWTRIWAWAGSGGFTPVDVPGLLVWGWPLISGSLTLYTRLRLRVRPAGLSPAAWDGVLGLWHILQHSESNIAVGPSTSGLTWFNCTQPRFTRLICLLCNRHQVWYLVCSVINCFGTSDISG